MQDELVIMNIVSLDYYRFNEVAAAIWALLAEGPLSEDAITAALLSEYEVDEEECRSAVAIFLDDALERHFVRAV